MISAFDLFNFLAIGLSCSALSLLAYKLGYHCGHHDGFKAGVRKGVSFATLKSHEGVDSPDRYYGG